MVVIAGLGAVLPEATLGTAQLESTVVSPDGTRWFEPGTLQRLTGVEQRRVAHGLHPTDLAAAALEEALRQAAIDVSSVDAVVYAGVSCDMIEPANAHVLHQQLGLKNECRVFDVRNACNSVLDAVDIAGALIDSGRVQVVAVAAGETPSLFVSTDVADEQVLRRRLPAFTLGDAGGAFVVTKSGPGLEIVASSIVSDSSEWDRSIFALGGTRGLETLPTAFEADGEGLERLAVEHVPKAIEIALDRADWEPDHVDLVLPHQVSVKVIRRICRRVGIPYERCEMTLKENGNTAAATIPLVLSKAGAAGRLHQGARVLLVGGAAGFSAHAIAAKVDCPGPGRPLWA